MVSRAWFWWGSAVTGLDPSPVFARLPQPPKGGLAGVRIRNWESGDVAAVASTNHLFLVLFLLPSATSFGTSGAQHLGRREKKEERKWGQFQGKWTGEVTADLSLDSVRQWMGTEQFSSLQSGNSIKRFPPPLFWNGRKMHRCFVALLKKNKKKTPSKAVSECKQIFPLLNDINYSWWNERSLWKYIPPFFSAWTHTAVQKPKKTKTHPPTLCLLSIQWHVGVCAKSTWLMEQPALDGTALEH